MSDFKFELDRAAVGEMLKSSQVQTILREHAERIRQNVGDLAGEYIVTTRVGSTRAYASVRTNSVHAARSEHVHNNLIKALK